MPRCKRCHRHIKDGEYGPICAKKRTDAEQLTLGLDKPSRIFRWDMTEKERHEAACRVIFGK